MLFTPIPVAIFALLMFAPYRFDKAAQTAYAVIIYLLFTIVYTRQRYPLLEHVFGNYHRS